MMLSLPLELSAFFEWVKACWDCLPADVKSLYLYAIDMLLLYCGFRMITS